MRVSLTIAVACSRLAAADGGGVYVAPDPGPTPEETLILEYINRARSDPPAESLRIAAPGAKWRGVDLNMFRKEMSRIQPVPPLVFNLDLLKAARRHAYYQTLHGQTHEETPGKKGYTGKGPGERVKAAGYKLRMVAENVFLHATSPWRAHSEFIVDRGPGGAGGMQPGRGHRKNVFTGRYREYGGSYLRHGRKASVTQVFGSRGDGRLAGGVVYVDSNGNGFYDIGEGLGGIRVEADGGAVKAWKSGAYAVPLGRRKAVIVAARGDMKFTKTVPAGTDNVKCDFVIPQTADVKKVKALLAGVTRYKDPNSRARFKATVNLIFKTGDVLIDDATRRQITEVSAPVVRRLEDDRSAVREALASDDMKAASKIVADRRKKYSTTPAFDWFNDAMRCARPKARYVDLSNYKKNLKRGNPNPGYLAAGVKAIRRELKNLKTEEWRTWLEDLAAKTEKLW